MVTTSVIYNSKFLKADSRQDASNTSCRSYIAGLGEDVIISDIFLSAGAVAPLDIDTSCCNIVFPLVGTVQLTGEKGLQANLRNGDIHRLCPGIADVAVKNTLENDTINFLHIMLPKQKASLWDVSSARMEITVKNRMISGTGYANNIKVGVYDSRAKDIIRLQQPGANLAAFVINGSFEIEGRLMEYRDSLMLRDIEEAEIEALSELAVLLIIDCSLL